MNGSQITQAAIQKAKQVAGGTSSSNGSATKKRKKELKPIITTDGAVDPEAGEADSSNVG